MTSPISMPYRWLCPLPQRAERSPAGPAAAPAPAPQGIIRRRQQDKLQEWESWERQTEMEEAKLRQQTAEVRGRAALSERTMPPPTRMEPSRLPPPPACAQDFQRQRAADPGVGYQRPSLQQYQQQYDASEGARQAQERQLDQAQAALQERVKRRQRQAGRWMPLEYGAKVAQDAAAAAQAQVAAQAAQERAWEAARAQEDAAAAAGYVRSRVRQKVSRFADLMGDMQQAQQAAPPYPDAQGLVRVTRGGAPPPAEQAAPPPQARQQQRQRGMQEGRWQQQQEANVAYQAAGQEERYEEEEAREEAQGGEWAGAGDVVDVDALPALAEAPQETRQQTTASWPGAFQADDYTDW